MNTTANATIDLNNPTSNAINLGDDEGNMIFCSEAKNEARVDLNLSLDMDSTNSQWGSKILKGEEHSGQVFVPFDDDIRHF